ncbi:MAG TPA: hypothetical protein PLG58_09140, partial [Flexilinea sp.]|nr:hypothetical protein [Flexilinea sp.]
IGKEILALRVRENGADMKTNHRKIILIFASQYGTSGTPSPTKKLSVIDKKPSPRGRGSG